YEVKKEWMRFSTGVVTALYWFVNAFTKLDESVLLLTPVYYPFHNAVKDTGRKLVTCGLVNENGKYHIDFDAFEKSIVDNDVKLFIQCSPHNPVGRVWT
ncbi:aminotransferase class I/II-fold pyridoxal phosphate-dependent enzyme, partial [Escherichia coli]|uniref:aminotransferase class I/II-fold pyridoxal phosphate-dependent enzyme n=1 Tax=Escherichia coli TaxID=562 RepID=UPI001CCDF413